MKLFGRKKNDEEEQDESDASEKKKRKRKRKKEPPKPWGKRERFIVLFFLLLTIGISVFLALDAIEWKIPGLQQIDLPNLSIPFVGEETIIIEGNRSD